MANAPLTNGSFDSYYDSIKTNANSLNTYATDLENNVLNALNNRFTLTPSQQTFVGSYHPSQIASYANSLRIVADSLNSGAVVNSGQTTTGIDPNPPAEPAAIKWDVEFEITWNDKTNSLECTLKVTASCP